MTSTELLKVLRRIDANASEQWEALPGVLRLGVGARRLQAFVNQSAVVIDGQLRRVSKPLLVKGETVLVPLTSVRVLLKAVGLEFEPASNEEDSEPAGEIGGPGLSPLADSSLPRARAPGIEASSGGLRWSQLADYAHREPPRRLTLICDRSLEEIARRIELRVSAALEISVSRVVIRSRRDNKSVLSQMIESRPDLVLDLMVSAARDDDAAASEGNFEVWTVHDAIWPSQPRGDQPASKALRHVYKIHQFQSLALSGVLREGLALAFPGRAVSLDVTPSYILRRVDAPSAGVLIPRSILDGQSRELESAIRALADGLIQYCTRMKAALGRQ